MTGPRDVAALGAAKGIMHYLSEHADAADTAEGIAVWWLGSRVAVRTVERALRYLVAEGQIEQQLLPDNTVVYRNRRAIEPAE